MPILRKHMKLRSFVHSVILFLICLFLLHSQINAQLMYVSYYTSIKEALDIVIIKVDRIAGEKYGEKAIAHIERSFKGKVQSDSIELPFIYTEWPSGKNTLVSVSDVRPVSFKVGKRYIAFLRKSHRTSYDNPYAAETEYIDFDQPSEIRDDCYPQIPVLEQLLRIANMSDSNAIVDSLLSLLHSNTRELKFVGIEALNDLKSEKATETFSSILRMDPDSNIRYRAALGLGYIRSDSSANALMECLQTEKEKGVRHQIIVSLGMCRAKRAAPMLLRLYDTEEYDIQNAILETVCRLGDSTAVPKLLHLFSINQDLQYRHLMAQTIASFHTFGADEFSSALLDTSSESWLKNAVIDGWRESGYTKGFDQIAKLTSLLCASGDHSQKVVAGLQDLIFPLFYAIGTLGTPEQAVSTLKPCLSCNNFGIRQNAVNLLKELMTKNITTELRKEIEEAIKNIPSQ